MGTLPGALNQERERVGRRGHPAQGTGGLVGALRAPGSAAIRRILPQQPATVSESNRMPLNPEQDRLLEQEAGKANWRRWGPYLSERAWGTVREDYSADGDAWNYFPHDHARSRAYR